LAICWQFVDFFKTPVSLGALRTDKVLNPFWHSALKRGVVVSPPDFPNSKFF